MEKLNTIKYIPENKRKSSLHTNKKRRLRRSTIQNLQDEYETLKFNTSHTKKCVHSRESEIEREKTNP